MRNCTENVANSNENQIEVNGFISKEDGLHLVLQGQYKAKAFVILDLLLSAYKNFLDESCSSISQDVQPEFCPLAEADELGECLTLLSDDFSRHEDLIPECVLHFGNILHGISAHVDAYKKAVDGE